MNDHLKNEIFLYLDYLRESKIVGNKFNLIIDLFNISKKDAKNVLDHWLVINE
tara:strand:- start:336 stop:494 length:159 start_codon:yes stop_codon:yes gene_type:complete